MFTGGVRPCGLLQLVEAIGLSMQIAWSCETMSVQANEAAVRLPALVMV